MSSQKRVGVSRRRGDGAENDGNQWSGWTLRMSRRLRSLREDAVKRLRQSADLTKKIFIIALYENIENQIENIPTQMTR